MAAAGLVTVTNTFENKTREVLHGLSTNLVAVEPTIEAIAAGLGEAIRRSADHVARVAGASVAWSRSWRTSFDDAFLARVGDFLASS
jgi:hypothetical protein